MHLGRSYLTKSRPEPRPLSHVVSSAVSCKAGWGAAACIVQRCVRNCRISSLTVNCWNIELNQRVCTCREL